MTITDWLNGIDAQAKAATKGPWIDDGDGIGAVDDDGNPVGIVCTDGGYYPPWGPDKEFIIAARTNVPQLVALLRAAATLLEELEAAMVASMLWLPASRLEPRVRDFLGREVKA